MSTVRRVLAVCALALALAAVVAAPGMAATPEEIYGDFALNRGVIAGDYPFEDLKAALEETSPDDPFYANFVRAVEDRLEADYLGRTPGGGEDLIGASEAGGFELPVPRPPDQSGDPPWPFIALTAIAGALLLTGAGSSIYRRARR